MTDGGFIFDVRCSGCRRRIGYSEYSKPLRNAVFCSEWCFVEPPVTDMEARNDLWQALVAKGMSAHHVSKVFGVAHSLVYRTLSRV